MKLYNTLGRKLEEFTPQNPPKVTFYSCGPTVYDFPHIGNWYTFIRYDLINRVLRVNGFKVDWVMNITDVGHLVSDADEGEDKLEKGAKREGKTAWDVAKKYTEYFEAGLKRLNIDQPTELPKATENIDVQIELVKKLEQKGHTYVIDDGVYFDTSTFADYGKMAELDLEHQKEGARVEVNKQKRDASDFALWKFSPNDEKRDMEWDSPWGKGFPGWHLECSAMGMKYLGETLDIHAGGIDHIPVHHTNEIAQSEAATGKPFAKFWLHMNFILVNGKKMSKSAQNFYTLEDIEKKGFDLMALQSHYRTEAHFSWDNLEAAQNRLKEFRSWADMRFQGLKSTKLHTNYTEVKKTISKEISDDLNTPKVLGYINGAISRVDDLGADSNSINELSKYIDQLLGLDLASSKDISDKQKDLLAQRQKAKDDKDFAKADQLRDQLKKDGLEIRDTSYGQIWNRI